MARERKPKKPQPDTLAGYVEGSSETGAAPAEIGPGTDDAAPVVSVPATVVLSDADKAARYSALTTELVRLDTLEPDPVNARTHGEANLAAIMASLERFGQDQPLVVQRAGRIVRKGNGRMMAMKRLGWEEAAVVWVDDDNWQAVARALADNRTAELAAWDETTLASLLTNLAAEGEDVSPLGWTPQQVERIVAGAASAAGETPAGADSIPANYQILITFDNEREHTAALEKLTAEGYDIRSLIS